VRVGYMWRGRARGGAGPSNIMRTLLYYLHGCLQREVCTLVVSSLIQEGRSSPTSNEGKEGGKLVERPSIHSGAGVNGYEKPRSEHTIFVCGLRWWQIILLHCTQLFSICSILK